MVLSRSAFYLRLPALGVGVSATLLGLWLVLAPGSASSASSPQPVLVELFTSEGCSSCPPADRLLMELDRKQPVAGATVVALSEHVDYWNSLGWRDPYSSHQWSERQESYARRFGLDSVYTPQIVVDGDRQATGSDASAVREAIEQSLQRPQLRLEISSVMRTGEQIQIGFHADAAPNATLYAAVADDSDRSSVVRGENAGRVLEHVAVARSLGPVATLQATPIQQNVEIAVPREAGGHLRLILFAQDKKSGRILGVTAREL